MKPPMSDWTVENVRVTLVHPGRGERVIVQSSRSSLRVTSEVQVAAASATRPADDAAAAKAERGDTPATAEEFSAYDVIAARERTRDSEPDKAVLRQLMKRARQRIADGECEQYVLAVFAVNFIQTRTEAILLRLAGWDVVPLLLDKPALAVLASGSVIAVRDTMGRLAIHPDRQGTMNKLFVDLHDAESKTLHLTSVIRIEPSNQRRLVRFAEALWPRARKVESLRST